MTAADDRYATDLARGIALAAELAVMAETDPDHPVLAAVRIALEVADVRRAAHRLLRRVALDVHGGDVEHWRALAAAHVPYAVLERRRALPGVAPRRTA